MINTCPPNEFQHTLLSWLTSLLVASTAAHAANYDIEEGTVGWNVRFIPVDDCSTDLTPYSQCQNYAEPGTELQAFSFGLGVDDCNRNVINIFVQTVPAIP